MSIVFVHPIEVNSGVFRCVNDSNPYQNFTTPIFSGMASTTPKMPSTVSGDNVFNIYQSNPGPGSDNAFSDSQRTGGIKFGVTPCAEKIDIQVVGRADKYGSGFDTLTITIDGTQEAFFQSTSDLPSSNRPADQVNSYNQTVTKNFTTHPPCGHIVNISGVSGTFANNNVGYDVKVTVTLNT